MKNIKRIAEEIRQQVIVPITSYEEFDTKEEALDAVNEIRTATNRDWHKAVQKANELYDELHKALATHDAKQILDAQLNLADLYNVPRSDLLVNIKAICSDRVNEILRGESPLS